VAGTEGLGCGVGLDGRIVQEEDGVVVHGEAVRLQAGDVIGSIVEDRLRRLALTVHGVGRHGAAPEVEKPGRSQI
jgi:hypothetical protein